MRNPTLMTEVTRVVSDLDQLEAHLHETEPSELVRHALERPDARPAAIVGAPVEDVPPELREPHDIAVEATLAGARKAVRKLRTEGVDVDLAPDEQFGAEAIIVLFGRPAILIQDGRFFPPPAPWEKLDIDREAIETTLRSVGRIELQGHPRYSWVGTGFLVSDDLVMTNRHVAKEFGRPAARGRWQFEPGMTARIDFAEELNSSAPREFPISEIVAVHDELDLALLRVQPRRGRHLPDPLPLAGDGSGIRKGREVYVAGYPAADPGRNDPQVMARIFNNLYEVKRLQPGELRSVQRTRKLVEHDCSTLGGNSGSCVVDLASHRVIGLHFQGRYLEANRAVALWEVVDDPLVKRAKLSFVRD